MSSCVHSKINLLELYDKIGKVDVLICSTSFEKRCLVIPTNVNRDDVSHALIVAKDPDSPFVAENKAFLMAHFGSKAKIIPGDNDNILSIADNIRSSLEVCSRDGCRRYLIDITTFTHEILLVILKVVLQTLSELDTIYLLYNPAVDYSQDATDENKWLSKGIGEIRSVLGYPGNFKPSQKSHLIVLLGYETERAELLIDAYEPAIISLGLGAKSESISQELYEINLKFHNKLKSKIPVIHEFTFSCIDPCSTRDAIIKQVSLFPSHNIVLAPMNTKISTIGTALASINDENLQICYAPAQQYNYDNYSIPSKECYVFELHRLLN